MTTTHGMGGQGAPMQRQVGHWVEVEVDEGVGPASWTGDESGEDDEADLKNMKRAELDDYARDQGLDPDEYSTKDDLLKALQ